MWVVPVGHDAPVCPSAVVARSDPSMGGPAGGSGAYAIRALPDLCLLLKRAALSRQSGKWDDDDFDVLADGVVVGRIFKAGAAPVGLPWMWTMLFDYRWPTHGYAASRETAMAAFAKSWRRE